jgi:hypothetical protein
MVRSMCFADAAYICTYIVSDKYLRTVAPRLPDPLGVPGLYSINATVLIVNRKTTALCLFLPR